VSVLTKKRAAWLSVASNTFLTLGKLAAGVVTGSVSVMSEAAHSAVDLVAAGIATFSVHAADKPPDRSHPYGHEKVENISGVLEGLLIFAAAAWIIYESVDRLIHGQELRMLGPAAAAMAASALINIVVATLLRRTALAERSVALEADAAHLFTDVYTSAGVFAGLVAIAVMDRFLGVKAHWIDPVVALLVAGLILSTAWRITRKSFLPLMDTAASDEEEACINEVLDEFRGMGVDFHKLRSRRAGGILHLDLHMGCKPGVSLERGHQVSHRLKSRLEECLSGSNVLIHLEPSTRAEALPPSDDRVRSMRLELIKDPRVCEVRDLKAISYDGEVRLEADLCLMPDVTLSESRRLSEDLRSRIIEMHPGVSEVVLGIQPADRWQTAISEAEQERIKELVGEDERLAGIHEMKVTNRGGRTMVVLRLAVPPSLPVSEAHRIAERLEDDIRKIFPLEVEVDVRVEPCREECDLCKAACPQKENH